MKQQGEYSLRWQKGQEVRFAEISVHVERLDQPGYSVEFENEINPAWRCGVLFGAECFREALIHGQPTSGGLHVRIVKVSGQPVDTTVGALAHATFHAIQDALQMDLERETQIDDDGHFVF